MATSNPISEFSLDGQTVIVTGSSQGLGRAIAERLAATGANLVLCAPESETDELEAVADEIRDADHDGTAVYEACDTTDRDDVESLIEATVDEFGELDVLVNNVGGGIQGPFQDGTKEEWDQVFELNVGSTVNCCDIAQEHLEDGGGAIVNIASMAGIHGLPDLSSYAAAKAAIINFTSSLAYEWSLEDVRVNAVAPGPIVTPRIEKRLDGYFNVDIDRETVARRVGKPEEVAAMVQVLASPASSYVTGETVTVGGVPRHERHKDVQNVNAGESVWM
ncbi:SDR family NAD(P)-dependent oxidoreductase [Halorarius halobius]|uniref:SDR family NAD(P)-dependent oxidoreductase n=1 Tax=Halorarius halobius TaxID=2962671 RepID=UPI0020CFE682|nr:SDR family NAD(P)-dependent oxidoreductase [Halorarius halobius]